jgi:hypothetical protein
MQGFAFDRTTWQPPSDEMCAGARVQAMVLFATDIAARGLDFPTVDWVVQVSSSRQHELTLRPCKAAT